MKRKHAPLPMEDGFDPPDEGRGADEALEMKRNKENIDACIGELPESQQTALALCFYEGVSNREAAEIMGAEREGARVASNARENFSQEQAWRR